MGDIRADREHLDLFHLRLESPCPLKNAAEVFKHRLTSPESVSACDEVHWIALPGQCPSQNSVDTSDVMS